MSLRDFHPAVSAWFAGTFAEPTAVQREAWPAIRGGSHTLLAAPTGSGKTLAAFLASIDALVQQGLTRGLADETTVLYISPLKALSNDVQKNLQEPLEGIRRQLLEQGLPDVEIRAWVRTGDTPQTERARMRRQPPHILVTTPESLYILLTSDSGRAMLQTVRTVIVDEIHAVAGNKRGAHLSLSLERLGALCPQPLVRVGLSATQKPIEQMARFLTGSAEQECVIADTGHVRDRDLAIEVTGSPLEAVMPNEAWEEVYDRLAELVENHRTTLIFVNTRRLAERAARHLADRIGEPNVTSHHGSLAKEHRLDAEMRLKAGNLKALVATASLELGIDIGDVDLVCQLGSPRSISAFVQRVGRSGHGVNERPKGRLFPLSRDDLVECAAIMDAVARGELDRIAIPRQPLDVLAQQIVAEVATGEWAEDDLFTALRKAWPYRDLERTRFDQVVRMLAQGFSTRRGRRGAYLHRDGVNRRLRPRRAAKLTAITNGGAIPDQFDYDVVLSPEGLSVGSLNEDFAFESLPGDIFQLGNTSYRILKIQQGKVYVEDARGQPPNIPFWFGEAPGRADELSTAVSRLRANMDSRLEQSADAARSWLQDELGLPAPAAAQLTDYLALAKAALGLLPTQERVIFERFFDESGDMHLVIHSPYGSRLNRAWGLALRKRFCRKFNFELQAAALEDSIVLSLGATHSFAMEDVAAYLKRASVRAVLTQALLAAPMFPTRWRWGTTISLAVKRNRNGKKVPAQFQRTDAEDLIAVVFPDQLACQENVVGEREIPDHPLVNQAIADCMHEVMDIDGLERLLENLEGGQVRVETRELTSPSPLAQEILNARPYAFLDDAPAEERRTLAVQSRHFLDPADAAEIGRLDPKAIVRVREEAWPEARSADELHDALCILGFVTSAEGASGSDGTGMSFGWKHLFASLCEQGRATAMELEAGNELWVAAERLVELQMLFPEAPCRPAIVALRDEGHESLDRGEALKEIVRSRLEGLGPVTASAMGAPLGLGPKEIEPALLALEQEGFVVRGHFSIGLKPTSEELEWCERRLLARIHRYTIKKLRREIEPVSAADFMQFLFRWQRLGEEKGEGVEALAATLEQLEGIAVSAAAWEDAVLPARIDLYSSQMLDNLCTSGRFVWVRLGAQLQANGERKSTPVRNTPITITPRHSLEVWQGDDVSFADGSPHLSTPAQQVLETLAKQGASFFADLVRMTGLLRTQIEQALSELVAWGLVSSDAFAGLRALITPASKRPGFAAGSRRRRRASTWGVDSAGRWGLVRRLGSVGAERDADDIEHMAETLLFRYGVVFRKVLEREAHICSWRELLQQYRRLEARGEIRGGRFVQGFSGEQFAHPEAVSMLRETRRKGKQGTFIAVSAADPLNLVGIITPGERLPANSSNRVLYRDGIPVAIQMAGNISFTDKLSEKDEWEARNLLLKKDHPGRFLPTGHS